ncbi:MAG TPA: mechanosensitive ion channel family protein [Gammaproteobacteria bacterium]
MEELVDVTLTEQLVAWLRAGAVLVVGLVLVRLSSGAVYRALRDPMGAHTAVTVRRFLSYGLGAIVLLAALRELGFSPGLLLGAAGIVSVAIGFAAQTSASNLVSGLFLVAEKSFEIGEVIKVGGTTGEVLSIDLLSVKLRTFDNLYVRVPNETLVKSEITNISRFPIRRFDLLLGVAYKEDLGRVHELLIEVADSFDLCLDEPRPIMIFQGFGESSLDLQFSVWAARVNYLAVRNQLPARVKAAFDAAGIEIPFPHRTLYAGSGTEPLPVSISRD